jgi:hypothetical protein
VRGRRRCRFPLKHQSHRLPQPPLLDWPDDPELPDVPAPLLDWPDDPELPLDEPELPDEPLLD